MSKLLETLFDEIEFRLARRAAQRANAKNARLRSERDRLQRKIEASDLETEDLLEAQPIMIKVET